MYNIRRIEMDGASGSFAMHDVGNTATRTETDGMGAIEVPSERLWGAQTQRSLVHFAVGDDRMPLSVIHALAVIKKAAAMVNRHFGKLPADKADLIIRAADEVSSGKLDREFPLRVWQTGSGTQTNMNVNEVIANRAIMLAGGKPGTKDPIHPNDHVNMSQSSNDAFPTAMHIAAAQSLIDGLIPTLNGLEGALRAKAAAFADIVKIGRTHLQDATPLTLGQEVGGWASLVARDVARLTSALHGLFDLAIGGTAVGTGLNAPPGFGDLMAKTIADLTDLPFRSHPDKFAALSAHDEIVFASGAVATTAGSLMKIANDIRWLASGPRSGLGELILPDNEPGSSIMPGKVNPTQCEAVTMVAVQVHGAHAAILFAGSQGNFELNVFKPVMIYNFLHAVRLMTDVTRGFVDYCVASIEPDRRRIAELVERSLMLVTALVPAIGYDRATTLAHAAMRDGSSLREANRKLGYVSDAEFDRLVRPDKMVGT
jgi:fumarate hydratase class II